MHHVFYRRTGGDKGCHSCIDSCRCVDVHGPCFIDTTARGRRSMVWYEIVSRERVEMESGGGQRIFHG